ncbi:LRRcap domain-containing protein [Favolaschia claudopus]|uniref:LRRcap domain-containing protein n=1 Tax=Favolaschia claudopus TaxID=2862362 RepID=A0AAW0C248_9AGAR
MSKDPETHDPNAQVVSAPTVNDTVAVGDEAAVSAAPPERSARVVLPEPEEESDEEPEEAFIEEDRDFLVELPDETEDLDLVHLKIGSLAPLRLPRFAAHLKKLCLRQNFISRLEPEIFQPLQNLQELDLYDNKVKHVGDGLNGLPELSVLDLSFNLIRTVPEALQQLPALHTVYFVQNRISKISNLQASVSLRSLELGGNKIRKIENLESLVNLEELWIGKNKIAKLENLGTLKRLRILSLQSNRITKLENLEELDSLEELYLSHNGVQRIEALEHSTKLTTLDLGNNFIPELENVSHLIHLQELWMSNNKIPNLHALDSQLKHITTLETLYLEGNPCQTEDMAGYRRKIILALPQLKQIDATYVKV